MNVISAITSNSPASPHSYRNISFVCHDQEHGHNFNKMLFSHLLTDDVIQVRNTDVCFNERDLIHLFREGPLLDIIFDSHVVVGCRPTLGNKHLLWEGRHGQKAKMKRSANRSSKEP